MHSIYEKYVSHKYEVWGTYLGFSYGFSSQVVLVALLVIGRPQLNLPKFI